MMQKLPITRFAARWAVAHNTNSPSFLQFRPLRLADLDEELSQTNGQQRGFVRTTLERERGLLTERHARFSHMAGTFRIADMEKQAELMALTLSHFLYERGLGVGYLKYLSRHWPQALSLTPNTASNPLSGAVKGDILDANAILAANPIRRFDCYFVVKKLVEFSSHGRPDLSSVALTDASRIIQQRVNDVTLEHGAYAYRNTDWKKARLLRVACDACEPNNAADIAYLALKQHLHISNIADRRPNQRVLDELDGQVLVHEVSNDLVHIINRTRSGIRLKRLELRSPTLYTEAMELSRQSETFHNLVVSYYDALRAAQSNDTRRVFEVLSAGLEMAIKPLRRAGANGDFRMADIVEVGARMLALDAPAVAYSSLVTFDLRGREEQNADSARLYDWLVSRASVRNSLEQVPVALTSVSGGAAEQKIRFLEAFASSPREYLAAIGSRYYFDLNRCLACRHTLIHEGRDETDQYLANVLLELFRLILSLRLAIAQWVGQSGASPEHSLISSTNKWLRIYDDIVAGTLSVSKAERFLRESIILGPFKWRSESFLQNAAFDQFAISNPQNEQRGAFIADNSNYLL